MEKFIDKLSNDEIIEIARKITEVHYPEDWRSHLVYEIKEFHEMIENEKLRDFFSPQPVKRKLKDNYIVQISLDNKKVGWVQIYDYNVLFYNDVLRKTCHKPHIAFEDYPQRKYRKDMHGEIKTIKFIVFKKESEQHKLTDELYKTEMTKKFGFEYQKSYEEYHEGYRKILVNNGIVKEK